MAAEYSTAIEYYVASNRVFAGQLSPKVIVIHGTGGAASQTVEQLGDWFRTDPNMSSSHFGIGRDGRVAQYVHLADGSAANCCVEDGYDPFWDPYLLTYKNLNLCTITVEHVNDLTNSLPPTPAQKEASFRLVEWLCERYGIPPERIKTHASTAPKSRRDCPGNYPMAELINYVKGALSMGVPQGWRDDGHNLTAPNGKVVLAGFRQYILSHEWDPSNVPLEAEHGQNPLELSNPGLGSGTQQVFRWSVLEWTQARGIFQSWVGQELLAMRTKINEQATTIAKLQSQLLAAQSAAPRAAEMLTVLKQIDLLASPFK